jgi:AraC-like DNA-binding protein
MRVLNMHQPFEIEYKENLLECPIGKHRHSFFELVYMTKGTGIQHVNQHQMPYYPENLFLVMPHDVQFTEIEEPTTFLFIRFNSLFLEGQKTRSDHGNLGDWVRKLEYIYHNTTHMAGCILRDKNDKPLFRALIEGLIREYVSQQEFHREIVQQLINTIITVVARNISLSLPERNEQASPLSMDILDYIHQHIYSPNELKAGKIAAHFNISLSYISEYFKKQTGESLQQYIISYKLKLVETRLQYSDMRMNEIVSELGFTDESHLNRTFKKYKGMSPSSFRKKTRINTQLLMKQAI